ncbi:winged helix-turn-helix transcriptional regulator [Sabulicella rubraurantiaca]|uniref:winged helix-turn-helix transcriptional regulator n=1 Tax=Sabulicella rubraurantiaca TaxID=2811429 RepID=UPI001A96C838|nr:helix-turn-helix domain-containing protein [Sabulicella rubraurantiaca]
MAKALSVIGDTWTFLVVREAFFAARRFGDFQERLGISRTTLSATLDKLVEAGVFAARDLEPGSRWKAYSLTPKGIDLFPVFLSLLAFGDRWLQKGVPPLALFHLDCRSWFAPRTLWAETGQPVRAAGIRFRIAAGYWRPAEPATRSRRPWRDGQVVGRRPCSVERTLSIVGDRWSFLILREMFHGNTRFDEIHRNLGIATNILSDRLKTLAAGGLIEGGGRGAYALTSEGEELFGPLALMKAWADRWLIPERKQNLSFEDARTGQPLTPQVVCSCCGRPVSARRVRYVTGYSLEGASDKPA